MKEPYHVELDGFYEVADVVHAPSVELSDDKRVPRGWSAIPIAPTGSGQSTVFRWATPRIATEARFRIAIAVDVREEKMIEVYLPQSNRVLDTLDIRYPSVFLPYEVVISASDIGAVQEEGIGLRMTKGEEPLWMLYGTDHRHGRSALLPHLYWSMDANPDRLEKFFHRMLSMASIQQFGWMEGCVLDGLLDLEGLLGKDNVLPVIQMHLSSFLNEDGSLSYENPRSQPQDGKLYGSVEATLPFAVMAKVWPDHSAIDLAIDWWLSHTLPNGLIGSNPHRLTAEGCYTAAYPLAVIAKVRDRSDLAALAVKQLHLRHEKFVAEDGLYVQTDKEGKRIWRNWARGCAWYILGFVRTLKELGDFPGRKELEAEYVRVSHWLMQFQQADGLWSCFIDEPLTGPETSGSAGIAAALALGVDAGLLPESAWAAAKKTADALIGYLTPDGFLTGVSQMNKAGEPLQRSNYRTISQMGMGLMAQLVAASNR